MYEEFSSADSLLRLRTRTGASHGLLEFSFYTGVLRQCILLAYDFFELFLARPNSRLVPGAGATDFAVILIRLFLASIFAFVFESHPYDGLELLDARFHKQHWRSTGWVFTTMEADDAIQKGQNVAVFVETEEMESSMITNQFHKTPQPLSHKCLSFIRISGVAFAET